MSVNVTYVSANCNQTAAVADWGVNNQICYGSSNAVLIYDVFDNRRVLFTLHGHKGRVNSVRWIRDCDYESECVSVSVDNTVIVWSLSNGKWSSATLTGHEGIVNVVDALYKSPDMSNAVVVSAGADSNIIIWTRQTLKSEFVLSQSINLGYNICLTLRLAKLPNCDKLIMATSNDNSKINLYSEIDDKFEHKSTLKGHEDWVRGLDFKIIENDGLLLASSSQDNFIRIWKFTLAAKHSKKTENDYFTLNEFEVANGKYIIDLETILAGHEGWIYSVNWSQNEEKLLSASLDKSMIIWELNKEANLWLENVRVGEVGGNTLGFYGGMFSKDGKAIMGHGYHGSFHLWLLDEDTNSWTPQVTAGGHFNEVVDLSWDPLGSYVISASYDQTTRIHAPWQKDEIVTWHEIARPQVHGYDMSCLAILGRYSFASGAEEKIVRIFQAPENFVENFNRICRLDETHSEYKAPKGASVPSLGLSNKAVFENDNADKATVKSKKDVYPEESHFTAIEMQEPPTEETLLQNTLWPETQKLYGHGYEIFSLASSPDGKLLATGCKASTKEHATILLWDTQNWSIVQKFVMHTLTVTQISFSPDSTKILLVSRDRRWSLFSRSSETESFQFEGTTDKKTGIHSRIIWCCNWTHDSKFFATGSRDGKLVVWTKNSELPMSALGQYEAASEVLTLKTQSITALAFAPQKIADKYMLAVGLESGCIMIYHWDKSGFKELVNMSQTFAHHLTVKRLAFRPILGKAGFELDEDDIQLASCSSDYSVRIYDIYLSKLVYSES
ncbi:PREDICTED: probable elongator complex protein 2 [Nicrophorus vespilloides]|uniref:Elongator complex protein 2 n=1 Tax=Nicrophorus vespilloides TaxID=110193 RepID=A0ABM1M2R4_NICVS|nr:PREDICTED: probable elongator complex protein 2 [Nicrophorus vespilloides]